MNNWSIERSAAGQQIAVTATNAATLVAGDDRKVAAVDVYLENRGTSDCYVVTGDSTAVATVLHPRVPAGAVMIFRKGRETHLAAICDTGGTTTLVVHLGEGQ